MHKKLLAAAVAGALAAPGIALAQVTISGKVGVSFQSAKMSGATVARLGNTSFTSINDNTSTLNFRMREDLGGGLAAYGQFEFRQTTDAGSAAGTGATGGPPQWIGLESKGWGNLRVGTLTGLHAVTGPDYTVATGTSYNSAQILAGGYAQAGSTYAMLTRPRNTIAWDSLTFNGFKMTAAYSTNAGAADADLSALARKGRMWNLIPQYTAANWSASLSIIDSKPDNGAGPLVATLLDEKGTRLSGEYKFANGFSLGGMWDKAKRKNVGAVAPGDVNDRVVWALEALYSTGPHQVAAAYTKAEKDKKLPGTGGAVGADTDASALGVIYRYSLSKRTNVFASWQKLTNKAAAAYGAFGLNTPAYTTVGFAATAGEDVTNMMVGMNHHF